MNMLKLAEHLGSALGLPVDRRCASAHHIRWYLDDFDFLPDAQLSVGESEDGGMNIRLDTLGAELAFARVYLAPDEVTADAVTDAARAVLHTADLLEDRRRRTYAQVLNHLPSPWEYAESRHGKVWGGYYLHHAYGQLRFFDGPREGSDRVYVWSLDLPWECLLERVNAAAKHRPQNYVESLVYKELIRSGRTLTSFAPDGSWAEYRKGAYDDEGGWLGRETVFFSHDLGGTYKHTIYAPDHDINVTRQEDLADRGRFVKFSKAWQDFVAALKVQQEKRAEIMESEEGLQDE